MIFEVVVVALAAAFLFFLVREKDLRYLLAFSIGSVTALLIETYGTKFGLWSYGDLVFPLGYPLFNVPVSVYLMYGSAAGLVIPFLKFFDRLRKENRFDKLAAYALIATGTALTILSGTGVIYISVGLAIAMVGFYLLVKSPTILYVGLVGASIEFLVETILMSSNQYSCVLQCQDFPSFFFGTAILASVLMMFNAKLKSVKGKTY